MPEAVASSSPTPVVDKSGERVRRMFGEIAPRYDLLNHLLSGNVDRYWRWRATQIADAQTRKGALAGQPLLDLCTGTGDLALAYDRSVRGKLRITAADFCPEMLAIGEKKGRKAGANDHIEWVVADANALPFADNTYQLVTAAFGLRNVSDTDAGLREMTRVCLPGGKVAVLEFTTPRWQPMKGIYSWYFRNILPRIGQAVMRNNSAAYEYLPESVKAFDEYEQLTARMESAGLKSVQYHPLTFGIATLYIGQK
ncbi:bifunctional demethylmenaquinone methyltransferase/2-methoxy-6-polyprenyl-1,4-benzoquinol methylase UbiE [Botrimarina hoheduenensis]|uniref:Demethylmenaquinone methyltransferase n=1 Tax=Botrimarina hoheduenensis TaxID=2528000 RepID=A0A5C5VY29_9BACT|nr:bifunctional demethylmenaquinone methyltransferase/2-methoxy-6-polyprenyl-1,4-benzoquinol methylase UbiE [Botrimarina hoheduenensis]TWT43370.1 UbiE/COQ5 methyltransferase [Botrimarina hoheduenensis]